jgi:hypothetical protein
MSNEADGAGNSQRLASDRYVSCRIFLNQLWDLHLEARPKYRMSIPWMIASNHHGVVPCSLHPKNGQNTRMIYAAIFVIINNIIIIINNIIIIINPIFGDFIWFIYVVPRITQ